GEDMNSAEADTAGAEAVGLSHAIRRLAPDMPVLLMTAWTSLETAVQLIKQGAADYVAKPWDDEKLLATVKNFLHMRELAQENARLRGRSQRARKQLAGRYDLRGLVYASDAMHNVVALAGNAAAPAPPGPLTGPTRSGTE